MAITLQPAGSVHASIADAVTALGGSLSQNTTIELTDAAYTISANIGLDTLDTNGFTLTISSPNVTAPVITIDGTGTIQLGGVAHQQDDIFFDNLEFTSAIDSVIKSSYGENVTFTNCTFNLSNEVGDNLEVEDKNANKGFIFEDCTFNVVANADTQAYTVIFGQHESCLTFRRCNISFSGNANNGSEFISMNNGTATSSFLVMEDCDVNPEFVRFITLLGPIDVTMERNKIITAYSSSGDLISATDGGGTAPGTFLFRNNLVKVIQGGIFQLEDYNDVNIYHNTFINKDSNWSTSGYDFLNIRNKLRLYGNHWHWEQTNHPGGFTMVYATFVTPTAASIEFDYNYVYSAGGGGKLLETDVLTIFPSGVDHFDMGNTGASEAIADGYNVNGVMIINTGAEPYTFTDYANDDYTFSNATGINNGIDLASATDYSGGKDIRNFSREAAAPIAYGSYDPDAVDGVVLSLSITAPATARELKTFNVTILDQDSNPAQGVDVTFNGTTYTSDASGLVQFTAPAVGSDTNYNITATKATYADAPQATVNVTENQVVITAPASAREGSSFTVTVQDLDGVNVNAATVSFNGVDELSDVNGEATFTAPDVATDTNYAVTATEANMSAATAVNVNVLANQLVLSAPASALENSGFTVNVVDLDAAAVAGATVSINGVDVVTDGSGNAAFTAPEVASDTVYAITATASGYTAATSIDITITNVAQLVILGAPTRVQEKQSFSVQIEDDFGNPVNIANVTFNGVTIQPQSGNTATFTAPERSSNQSFDVTASLGGYLDAVAVSVLVNDASPFMTVPATVNKEATFDVNIVDSNYNEPIPGIDVTFDGVTVTTDSNGDATFTAPNVTEDTDYTVSFNDPDYTPSSLSETITVDALKPGLTIIRPGESVNENTVFTVIIRDEFSTPVEGVTVSFNNTGGLTDINGEIQFTAPEVANNETRNITATKDGYDIAPTVGITVTNVILPDLAILTVSQINENQAFLVEVEDGSNNKIEGATVNFNGTDYTTDVSGAINITAPEVAVDTDYTITATKTGYNDAPSVQITVQDVILPDLTVNAAVSVNERDTFTVTITDLGSPVDGVDVLFNSTTLTTNAQGQVTFTAPAVVVDSSFSITANKQGYNEGTDSINVLQVAESLSLSHPANVQEETNFVVVVTNNFGDLVENATVSFNSQNYVSNAIGEVTIPAPEVTTDSSYSVFASKPGNASASSTLTVTNFVQPLLSVSAPATVNEGEDFTVTVTSDGNPVEAVSVTFNFETLSTNAQGQVQFTASPVSSDATRTIGAVKTGYTANSTSIQILNVEDVPDPQLSIGTPLTVTEEDSFTVTISDPNTNPVANATVSFAGTNYLTNVLGQVTFEAPQVSSDQVLLITASKVNFQGVSQNITVENIPEGILPDLSITGPSAGNPGDTVLLTVYNDNSQPLFGAIVTLNGFEKATNAQGQVTFTLPDVQVQTVLSAEARFFGYDPAALDITISPTVVTPEPGGSVSHTFPINALPSIKGVNSAELFGIADVSMSGVEAGAINLTVTLAENQVNHRKYKLNSYLIKDQLIDQSEEIELYKHQRAKYYLSEENDLQTITEHLRTK